MTTPIYYTKDNTNDGVEPAQGTGGAIFTIGKLWSPSTLSYVTMTADAAGGLVIGGSGPGGGTSGGGTAVNVAVVDPYSYTYTWDAVTRKLATKTRTLAGVSQTKTYTWGSSTGKLQSVTAWA